MAWDDAPSFEDELKAALDVFDWSAAADICDRLVRRIHDEPQGFPEGRARTCLSLLRRKRLFKLVTQVAEALLASGRRTPLIRRQYAQALIDRGLFNAPELVLQSVLHDSHLDEQEEKEARGLMGRIYKQLYVDVHELLGADAGRAERPRLHKYLRRAMSEYQAGYRLDPWNNYWHGINAVALLARAERDGLSIAGVPDYRKLAQDIRGTFEGRAGQTSKAVDGAVSKRGLDAWELATMLEALIALGEYGEARAYALEYAAHPEADAFEIASTMRQLEEVWQLTESEPPGSLLLPICRAALLQREGGAFRISPDSAARDLSNIEEAESTPSEVLGGYREALRCSRAVARIESREGVGRGTGLLVRPEDFLPPGYPREAGGVLLLTNAHVVSPVPFPTALKPSEALAVFQLTNQRYEVGEVVWSSPPDELDAALLTLRGGAPEAEPLRLAERWEGGEDVPKRAVVIGHPGAPDSRFSLKAGGDDERFSFQDAVPTGADHNYLRYTTPTPAGSSGSAVFDPRDWSVIALHHSGRGGGEATHANEAAPLPAIRAAARESLSAGRAAATRGGRGYSAKSMPRARVMTSAMPPTPGPPPQAAPRFYFALEGEGARGRVVRLGADVDFVFDYSVPPVVGVIATVEKAEGLEQARRTLTPLGVTVAPVGFGFRNERDAGRRVMNFYDGGARADRLRFELRADGAEPANGAGFHVIFDARGHILYQLFLPVRLAADFSDVEEDEMPPLSLDLDQLNAYAETAADDARALDAAVEEVLSHA
ncbi:MAG: trypsin-like peptidase domain-containing protein [Acidobacteria bacterium]|nr:trypsin-like peptidase domain-containing protein [Acidobacteriota bacterium]